MGLSFNGRSPDQIKCSGCFIGGKMKRKPIDTSSCVPGCLYKCEIEHWSEEVTKVHIVTLLRVDEDDCVWRFADDHSELSYDWHVVAFSQL